MMGKSDRECVLHYQDAVGVVTVLSGQPHPWSAEGELALLAFTDLAALLIASMTQGQQQSELAAQLQTALDSRAVIEQAKGVLIGQQGMSPQAAYELLRARARSQRRKLAPSPPMWCAARPRAAEGLRPGRPRGLILLLLGAVGRSVGGRRHYW
jgi:hypothetical protein